MKLAAFDMDGVLFDIASSWVAIHDHFDTNNDASLKAYMDGEIDDHEFMRRDIKLWLNKQDPISISLIEEILDKQPFMEGCIETLQKLKEEGLKVGIISGGLDLLVDRIRAEVLLDFVYVNSLVLDDDGNLTGEGVLNVVLVDKTTPLLEAQKMFGISKEDTASIGNGSIDVSMFKVSGTSIAFNPEDEICANGADIVIRDKDLSLVLPHILG